MKKRLPLLLSVILAVGSCFGQRATYTASEVDAMCNRFLEYASIRSASVPDQPGDTFIVTQGQRDMAMKVFNDLKAIKGVEVKMSKDFYIYARIRSNIKKSVPSVCIMSHLDITPEVPEPENEDWAPVVHRNYDGGDIVLGNGVTLSPESPESETLKDMKGQTIVTSDGTTHLGGDCKAGVAIMVELARHLAGNPSVKHGDVYLYFTQNEDVGLVARRFEPGFLGTVPDILLDLDGHRPHSFAVENFSAINGVLLFKGNMAHPSDGFYSGYADASTAASYWTAQFPPDVHPSQSKGREGYVHIYKRIEENGNVKLFYRLRYFDKADSARYAEYFDNAIRMTNAAYPRVEIASESRALVYDNVAYSMHPKTKEVLLNAGKAMGWDMKIHLQRAGTTCAMLACKGIAGGANIFGGQHSIHSIYEWVSIEELVSTMHYCLEVVRATGKID